MVGNHKIGRKEKVQKIVSFIAERGDGKNSGKKQKDSRDNRSLEIQI